MTADPLPRRAGRDRRPRARAHRRRRARRLRDRLDRPLARHRAGRGATGRHRSGRGRDRRLRRRGRCAVVPQGGNTGMVGGSVPDESGAADRALDHAADPGAAGRSRDRPAAGRGRGDARGRPAGRPRRPGWSWRSISAPATRRRSAASFACDAGGLRALRHGTARRQLAWDTRRCSPTAGVIRPHVRAAQGHRRL